MSDTITQDPAEQQDPAAPASVAEGAEPTEAAPEPAEGAETAPAEPAAPAETPEEAKHRRAGGWQRKIEKLERERELLLEQLAAQRGPKPAEPAKEKTQEEREAEYVDALVERRLQAREEQRRQAEAQAAFQARTEAVRTALPDFDEVIATNDAPVSPAVAEALLTSEQGPRIMYEFAANPAELARINALPPLAAAREIGRLEARLASVTAAPKTNPAVAPQRPAAPAPITPVTARGPTTVKDPSKMSFEEWRNYRDSQAKR